MIGEHISLIGGVGMNARKMFEIDLLMLHRDMHRYGYGQLETPL